MSQAWKSGQSSGRLDSGSKEEQRGFRELRNYTGEDIAYTTDAVRLFYRKEGRTVESPEDVQKAFDYLTEETDWSKHKGRLRAIRTRPYISELGMMLVKNTIKKTPTTIGSSMRGIV
jgi:hypothetical protein